MADLPYMYAIVIGVFVVFTAILFGARTKRLSGRSIEEREEKSRERIQDINFASPTEHKSAISFVIHNMIVKK